jgi:hypothetical protein
MTVVTRLLFFYVEKLLAARATLKLKDHPFSAIRCCLFNAFAATVYNSRPFPPSATRGRAMLW